MSMIIINKKSSKTQTDSASTLNLRGLLPVHDLPARDIGRRTCSELNDFSSAFSFSILGWTRIRERLTLTLVKGKLNVYFT